MSPAAKIGRRSLFRGKDRDKPLKAYVTKIGRARFHEARKELAKMVGWNIAEVSEGDCVEWCLRGKPVLREENGDYVEVT